MFTVSGKTEIEKRSTWDRHFQQNSWFFLIQFFERCKWTIKLSNLSSLHIYKCKQVRHISTYHARTHSVCLFIRIDHETHTKTAISKFKWFFMLPFDNFDKRTSDFRDFEMAQSMMRRNSTVNTVFW